MARIWYSVMGEGMGHAIRSGTIIAELIKKHTLFITACDRAYPYLKKKFGPAVRKIEGSSFIYENNTVHIGRTILEFLKNMPKKSKKNIYHIFNAIKKFNPDLIISDFEPASHYFAFFLGIPVISLDNINILSQCEIDVDAKYNFLFWSSLNLINLFHPRSDYYLIPSIANVKPKAKNVFLFPPVLRKEILLAKEAKKNFVLVYQTSSTNKSLLPVLKSINEHFVIYGMNQESEDKNLTFKQFNEQAFINDLRSCKAAIINGGFTVIGEAVYLKKPLLVVPVGNQFEQIFNGMTLKKEGFGDWHESLDKEKIENFLANLPYYKNNLNKLGRWDNSSLFKKIDELILELKDKPKHVFGFAKSVEKFFRMPKFEQTLTIIKPDGVEKGLIGEIIKRFELAGIKPVAMKMIRINKLQAHLFYKHLKGKVPTPVFNSIVNYMTSNRVVAIVWQGRGVVKKVREICGPTDPKKAPETTIRAFSDDDLSERFKKGKAVRNIIHSSAKSDEAKKEINFFFLPWEIHKP